MSKRTVDQPLAMTLQMQPTDPFDGPEDDSPALATSPTTALRQALINEALSFDGVGAAHNAEDFLSLIAPASVEHGDASARGEFMKVSTCGLVCRGLLRRFVCVHLGGEDNEAIRRDVVELFEPYRMGHAMSDIAAIALRLRCWRSPSSTVTSGAPLVNPVETRDADGVRFVVPKQGAIDTESVNRILSLYKRPIGAPLVAGDMFMIGSPEHVATATSVSLRAPTPSQQKSGVREWIVTSIDGGQRGDRGEQCIKTRVRTMSVDNARGHWFAVDEHKQSRPLLDVLDLDAFIAALRVVPS